MINQGLQFLLQAAQVLIVFLVALPLPSQAQQSVNPLEEVRDLGLDSTDVGIWVHHSQGSSERAVLLGAQMAGVKQYFADSLALEVPIRLALLNSDDFAQLGDWADFPYGVPFVVRGVAVSPSELGGGVVDLLTSLQPPPSTRRYRELQALEISYAEASQIFSDLLVLHEFGHVIAGNYGLNHSQAWFREFIATYFGYAYSRTLEPELARIWEVMSEVILDEHVPLHTTLEELNEKYFGVGLADYGWYQSQFVRLAKDVYDREGLNFLSRVRQELSNSNDQRESVPELLEVLERTSPDFVSWSRLLGQ